MKLQFGIRALKNFKTRSSQFCELQKIKRNSTEHHLLSVPTANRTVQVDNINTAIEEVKKKGIRCLGAKPTIGAHGKPVMFLHPKDCGGVLMELEEA